MSYAPQLQLLKRAVAVITHAGLNTVLESLAEGVPLVAVPLGNDQPGVAARVAAHGAGIVISRRKLNVPRLCSATQSILEDPQYREAASRPQTAMRQINGRETAADIVEDALKIRQFHKARAKPAPPGMPIFAQYHRVPEAGSANGYCTA
jgi:zeaxanthin glucosyltransferase